MTYFWGSLLYYSELPSLRSVLMLKKLCPLPGFELVQRVSLTSYARRVRISLVSGETFTDGSAVRVAAFGVGAANLAHRARVRTASAPVEIINLKTSFILVNGAYCFL